MTATTLIVIAKAPVAGAVKTRLCPPCTPVQAAGLAAAALADTIDVVDAVRGVGRRVLCLDGPAGGWVPAGFEVIPQRGAGLAARLAAAFADVGEAAFLIGMDTPQIDPALLRRGLDALETHGSAVGPATDGGYWGIGLRAADERVFEEIPMSSDQTCREQLRRLRDLGTSCAILPALRDVDRIEDALAVADMAPHTRFAAAVAAVTLAVAA